MIIKLVLIVFVFAILILYLKSINSELALLCSIACSVLLIIYIIDSLGEVFSLFERLSNLSSISESTLKIVFKVLGVAYIVEFSAQIVEEFGLKSLADKLVFVGKIVIIILSAPIIEAVFTVIESLL